MLAVWHRAVPCCPPQGACLSGRHQQVRGKKICKSHYFKRFILRNIVPQYPTLSERPWRHFREMCASVEVGCAPVEVGWLLHISLLCVSFQLTDAQPQRVQVNPSCSFEDKPETLYTLDFAGVFFPPLKISKVWFWKNLSVQFGLRMWDEELRMQRWPPGLCMDFHPQNPCTGGS